MSGCHPACFRADSDDDSGVAVAAAAAAAAAASRAGRCRGRRRRPRSGPKASRARAVFFEGVAEDGRHEPLFTFGGMGLGFRVQGRFRVQGSGLRI